MKRSIKSKFARIPTLAPGLAGLFFLAASSVQASVSFIGAAVIDGTGTDFSGLSSSVLEDGVSRHNALNGFGSGIAYAGGNNFYLLSDRGPNKVSYTGGGVVDNTTSYENRFQKFTINLTPVGAKDGSGHYASYTVAATNTGTALLKDPSGQQYTGISATSGGSVINPLRFDPEGIRVAPDGTVWTTDEYGPYIRHFDAMGHQIGLINPPTGFTVANSFGTVSAEISGNQVGRVGNKGMEGCAITPDGKTLVGIMQSPLIQDGGISGTSSLGVNVRIVVMDLTNPTAAAKQYIYPLDSTATSNSELLAINSHKFLIDERDAAVGGVKKLYMVDLNQPAAPTDLTGTAYSGVDASHGLPASGIPAGITALNKTLFANIGQLITSASPSPLTNISGNAALPDKIEGYCWGPDLPDGRHLLLATNDNDFVQVGGAAGSGFPNYIFAFAVDASDVPDFQAESFDSANAMNSIDHIIVVYQENWTFDGLYGSFPGANGIANASSASLTQIDRLNGNALSGEGASSYNNPAFVPNAGAPTTAQTTNPPPALTTDASAGVADTRVSSSQNTLLPYALTNYISPTLTTGDIYHRYWQEQFQILGTVTDPSNGDSEKGNNSGFVTWSDNPGLVMSHYDATSLPEGLLAQQYTISDNFFHSAFGGSFLNHQFLITAQAPVYDAMPASNNSNIAYLDSNGAFVMNTSGTSVGKFARDGSITPLVGDSITVTVNGSSSTVTLTSANTEAYAGASGTKFDKHYVVNTTRSVNLAGNGENGTSSPFLVSLLPSQNDSNPTGANSDTRPYIPTIGDSLSAANVSWKWYSGGWTQILAYSGSNPSPTTNPSYATANASLQLQYHHQPFAYYDNYAPFDTTHTVPAAMVGGFAGAGTGSLVAGQSGVTRAQNSAAHLQDETNFFTDVASGNLPAVSFIKAVGVNNEHPGYAALQVGQAHVASIVQAVQANPALWAHTAIIVTYDEHGGRWDHAPVPTRDIWGPGERVPLLLISPLVRKGYVDHTQRDTSAVLSTIEQRFGLAPLNTRDGAATTFFDAFTQLDVSRGVFASDRRTGTLTQTITVTNRGRTAVSGPIQLAFDSLSSNTSLSGAAGTTANNAPMGSPYVTLTSSGLASGASASITVRFTAPTSGGVTYTPRTVVATNP